MVESLSNNDSDVMNDVMQIYKWPFGFVIVYSILGIVGNAVVLYIYYFKYRKSKTRCFIMCLAFLDLCNSAVNMPIEAVILWNVMEFDVNGLCKFTRGATFLVNNVTALVFIAIAVDRFLLLYRPFKSRVLTVHFARRACFVSLVGGILTSFPGFILYGSATIYETIDQTIITGVSCYILDEYARNTSWPMVFSTSLFALYIVVFSLLSVLYIAIGKKIRDVTRSDMDLEQISLKLTKKTALGALAVETLSSVGICDETVNCDRRSSKRRSDIEAHELEVLSSRRETNSRRFSNIKSGSSRRITILMSIITIGFILSFTPYLVIVTIRYIDSALYFTFSLSGKIAYHVLLRSYFLNSVINPIIYGYVNKEFRLVVWKTVKNVISGKRDRTRVLRRGR